MIIALPKLDIRRLSADFCDMVRADLSPDQLARVNAANAAETDTNIDHVQDYCNVPQLLADAIGRQFGRNWSWSEIEPAVLEDCCDRARAAGYVLRRILVACEFSATVRDRLAVDGHSVLSCDLLPSDAPGPHYQGDVRDILSDGWHAMVAHSPCTYLCNSGVKHLVRDGIRINPDRWLAMRADAELFRDIGAADIPQICRENPVMHGYAREIAECGPADQYVQPNRYGHDVSKRTGLWLKGLRRLVSNPANHVPPRVIEYRGKPVKRWANQSPCGADRTAPSEDRGHKRSVFFAGIADAMAVQWFGSESARHLAA